MLRCAFHPSQSLKSPPGTGTRSAHARKRPTARMRIRQGRPVTFWYLDAVSERTSMSDIVPSSSSIPSPRLLSSKPCRLVRDVADDFPMRSSIVITPAVPPYSSAPRHVRARRRGRRALARPACCLAQRALHAQVGNVNGAPGSRATDPWREKHRGCRPAIPCNPGIANSALRERCPDFLLGVVDSSATKYSSRRMTSRAFFSWKSKTPASMRCRLSRVREHGLAHKKPPARRRMHLHL